MAGIIRSITSIFVGPASDDADDYRNVPASDQGNAGYRDRGLRGSYTPSRKPFRSPEGVKFMGGYGADAADLQRGYIDDCVNEDPAYDKANYADRSTVARHPDEDFANTGATESDFAFRSRNRTARGFLTRPRLPTER